MPRSRDLPALQKSIRSLQDAIGALAESDDLNDLLELLHEQADTAPAELLLVERTIASMRIQVGALAQMQDAVTEASRMLVGTPVRLGT
jgi:hypothetical protein